MQVDGGQAAGTGPNPNDPKFQEAEKACAKELGDQAPTDAAPAGRAEFQDQSLAFAKCMRANGVDIPDPIFDASGQTEQPTGGLRPDMPGFKEAAQKCSTAMPGHGGGVDGTPDQAGDDSSHPEPTPKP